MLTGKQVQEAMITSGIERVEHHDCSICGHIVAFFRDSNQLYFDPRCDCNSIGSIELRPWQDAADWINMQSSPEIRSRIAAKFGIESESSI